jgi:hypothetical protein
MSKEDILTDIQCITDTDPVGHELLNNLDRAQELMIVPKHGPYPNPGEIIYDILGNEFQGKLDDVLNHEGLWMGLIEAPAGCLPVGVLPTIE